MVSLIKNLEYFTSISDKPKLLAFRDFLENNKIVIKLDPSNNEVDIIFINLISSFFNNDKKQFLDNFNKINIRIPTSESVWVHDNFLIFVLICCVEKFEADRNWLKSVIQARDCSNIEYQSINKTLNNIVNNNLQSNENLYVIVIAFLHLLSKPNLSSEILDNVFLRISNDTKLLDSKNDFLIMITLMAFEVIIINKDTPDAVEISNLKKFRELFLRRILIIREIIYWILLIIFIILCFKFIREYNSVKDYLSDLSIVFQLGGLALLVFFKWIRKKIELLLLKLLGYKKYFTIINK